MASAQPLDFPALIGPVARRLLGEPNKALSNDDTLRWGNHGSLKVDLDPGCFHDKEANEGGGTLDLIMRERRCDIAGALRWLEDAGLKKRQSDRHAGRVIRSANQVFYDYADEHGQVLFRVERRGKDAVPPFLQHGPDGKGGFHSARGCMQGVRRVPYRLPELLAAPADTIAFVCEGEKDSDRLASLGLIATTNPGGAAKFTRELAKPLAGRRVVALQDNDEAGAKHVTVVLEAVAQIAAVATSLLLPNLGEKEDVSDWLARGGDAAELTRLAEAALASCEAAAREHDAGGPSDPGRRIVAVRAGELPRMATEGEQALIEAGSPIYSRGGSLVRPVVEEVDAAKGRKTKIARLCPVSITTLCDHLARVATWVKFNARKRADVITDVPSDVSATILARDGEWKLPKLAGVITTPTLRPDGTILSEPGYDPATQLLLMSPPPLPPIPDKPTMAQASAALKLLEGLLSEFPFVDEASRSVALSALITPVVRGAMSVVPLHAISAPVPGSGKSYIIDVAAVISTGDRAPVIAAGRTEEETEKRLVSALLGAQPIVSIDNVNGELGGDMLCQMIERPLVDVRILGQSKLVRVESRATTFATGNNIRLVGDMTRRVVLCSLDPDMERPELRQFEGDPVAKVFADRGRYIAAALTVVRAYVAAGFPGVLPSLASFEDWSRLVRSALVWLGCVDPLETMNKARGEDPVTSTLTALFGHWYQAADGIARTVGQVKELASEKDMAGNMIRPDFAEALSSIAESRTGGINSAKLGKYLASYQGRIVDGLKLTCTEDGHAKQKLWKVVRHV